MASMKTGILACIASLNLGLLAQDPPQPAPPQIQASETKRIPQTSDDFYNNNPVFNLRLAGTTPLWVKNLVKEGLKTYDPFFERDRILLADGEWLYALDPGTGNISWKHKFDRDLDDFRADGDLLLLTDHRAVSLSSKSWIHAFSFQNDKQIWEREGSGVSHLVLSAGHIYHFTVGVFSFTLHSMTADGKDEWSYKTKGSSPLYFLDDLIVICPSGQKKLIALRRKDGTEAWTLPLDSGEWELAYHDGIFYETRRTVNPFLKTTGTVYVNAIDLKSGKPLWAFQTEADDGWFTEDVGGIVSDGEYCVLNTNRRLIGLDAHTGKQLWTANPDMKESFLESKPIILSGTLFAIQAHKKKASVLQFLDLATGVEKARLEAQDEVLPPAKVVGRSLFLCFRHGDMLALPLSDAE